MFVYSAISYQVSDGVSTKLKKQICAEKKNNLHACNFHRSWALLQTFSNLVKAKVAGPIKTALQWAQHLINQSERRVFADMSYESKCFLFGELSFHFLSTAQSTSDPIIYRISYIKSPPWSMIGYKRRLSVCGSNCCGNAPRLDDPPSIHSHSQKTHTTDHRKRTRYIINWNKVPKKSHTICRKYVWIKNICLIKKGIRVWWSNEHPGRRTHKILLQESKSHQNTKLMPSHLQ